MDMRLASLTRMADHFVRSHALLRLTVVATVPHLMITRLMAACARVIHLGAALIAPPLRLAAKRLTAMAMATLQIPTVSMDACVHALKMHTECGVAMIVPFHQLAPVQTIAVVILSCLEMHAMGVCAIAPMDGPAIVVMSPLSYLAIHLPTAITMAAPATVTTAMDAHAMNVSTDGRGPIVKQGQWSLVMQPIATTTETRRILTHRMAVFALVTLVLRGRTVPFQKIAIIRIVESIPLWMMTALMGARATASMVGLAVIARPHRLAPRLTATAMVKQVTLMQPMDVFAPATQMRSDCGLAHSARLLLCLLPVLLQLIATAMAILLIPMPLMDACVHAQQMRTECGVAMTVPSNRLAALITIAVVMLPWWREMQFKDVFASATMVGLAINAKTLHQPRPGQQMAIQPQSNAAVLTSLRSKNQVMNSGPHLLQRLELWSR